MLRKIVIGTSVTAAVGAAGYYAFKTPSDRYEETSIEGEYDFIVVGGGTAGCVLASRLSENPNHTVLLIEAGPDDETKKEIQVPLQSSLLLHSDVDWKFKAHGNDNTKRKIHSWPRGKVLGGSSSINWMLFVRGNKEDYNEWERQGCTGWRYDDVLPYFKKLENYDGPPSDYRAKGGPLPATTIKPLFRVSELFIEAAQELGLKEIDYNAEDQIGVSFFQRNVLNGERHSTAQAYLKNTENRPNLTILTCAHVSHVNIENNVANGVTFFTKKNSGKEVVVTARREVILAAGAIGSPQILLLSGVGPREQLESLGITVKNHLPGVGENLQDHLFTVEAWETHDKLNFSLEDIRLKSILEYKLWKTGILSSGGVEVNSFIKTEPNLIVPDIQFHFISGVPGPDVEMKQWIDKGGAFAMFDSDHDEDAANFPTLGFGIGTTLLHPESRGHVRLFSKHPLDYPIITPNYLSHPKDVHALVEGLKFARRFVHETKTFKGKVKKTIADHTIPFPVDSKDYIEERIKRSAATLYHPVGTCKMGPGSDPMAVVDPQLMVHGVNRLRVIDASVMPTLTSGNTHIPTVMIAEKSADIIKAYHRNAAL